MSRPQELRIEWSGTADRQLQAAYLDARESALIPGFDVFPITARDIVEDLREFEQMCRDHWSRHGDLLFDDQAVNRRHAVSCLSLIAWSAIAPGLSGMRRG